MLVGAIRTRYLKPFGRNLRYIKSVVAYCAGQSYQLVIFVSIIELQSSITLRYQFWYHCSWYSLSVVYFTLVTVLLCIGYHRNVEIWSASSSSWLLVPESSLRNTAISLEMTAFFKGFWNCLITSWYDRQWGSAVLEKKLWAYTISKGWWKAK